LGLWDIVRIGFGLEDGSSIMGYVPFKEKGRAILVLYTT
jgi:hypothetical protein